MKAKSVFLTFSRDTNSYGAGVHLEFPSAEAADKFIDNLNTARRLLPDRGATRGNVSVGVDETVKVSINAGKLSVIGREYEKDEPHPHMTCGIAEQAEGRSSTTPDPLPRGVSIDPGAKPRLLRPCRK